MAIILTLKGGFHRVFRSIKKAYLFPFLTLVQKGNKAFEQGHDVINLGQGNPAQSTPPPIIIGKKQIQTVVYKFVYKFTIFYYCVQKVYTSLQNVYKRIQ